MSHPPDDDAEVSLVHAAFVACLQNVIDDGVTRDERSLARLLLTVYGFACHDERVIAHINGWAANVMNQEDKENHGPR